MSSKTTEETTKSLLNRLVLIGSCPDTHALGLHTDALARFERGADPELSIVGFESGWFIGKCRMGLDGDTTKVGSWNERRQVISFDVADLNRFLGTALLPVEIKERHNDMDFDRGLDTVSISTFLPIACGMYTPSLIFMKRLQNHRIQQ